MIFRLTGRLLAPLVLAALHLLPAFSVRAQGLPGPVQVRPRAAAPGAPHAAPAAPEATPVAPSAASVDPPTAPGAPRAAPVAPSAAPVDPSAAAADPSAAAAHPSAQAPAAPADASAQAPAAAPLPSAEPSAPPLASAPAADPRITLTLRAPPGVAFISQRVDPPGAPRRACTGDCETRLSPGRYRFALTHDVGPAVEAPGQFDLRANDELAAVYRSARPERIAGGVILGVGLPAALGALFGGAVRAADRESVCDDSGVCEDAPVGTGPKTAIALGALGAVACAVVGGWLVNERDEARVQLAGESRENRVVEALPLEVRFEPPPPRRVRAAPPAPTAAAADMREAQSAAPPPAQVASAPPAPRRPVGDVQKLAAQHDALLGCFDTPPLEPIELKLSIDMTGHAGELALGRPLPAAVAACVRAIVKRIDFAPGLPRSLRATFTALSLTVGGPARP